MGKTPGKWIKNFLLGKKSSKSSPSKGNDVLKSSNKTERVVSSTILSISDPTIPSPVVGTVACNNVGLENQVRSDSQSNEVVPLYVKEHGSSSKQADVCLVSPEETEKLKLDQAATKAQAAFRGYAARREFRSQKCIIMLQAQIRGHLVRRQAVSTLCCVKGIVKFQALVRRHKDEKNSNSLSGTTTTKVKRLSNSAFVHKLRSSLPSVIPLRLQYGPEDPNYVSLWLDRWTNLLSCDPPSDLKKNLDLKPRKKRESSRKAEAEQEKPKRTPRRLSGSNTENGSLGPTSDSDKGKRNPKKSVSNNHPVNNTLKEHSPNEIDKVKRGGLRKSSDSIKEVSDRSPVENGKLKQRIKKTNIDESPKKSDLEKKVESLLDLQSMEIKELSPDLDCVSNDNQRHNERRASLPANFDPQENSVHSNNNTPKVPSYMAATESAKAKLRAQGSPRFSRDVAEKNVLLRRHSLSSSTNSMLSSLSPRAHRLVQSTGKGVVRGDRSFSSSRDGGDKLIQAEWRR